MNSHATMPNEAGTAITVKGRRFFLRRAGRGTPTVILETGLGAESIEWQPVLNAVAVRTTVVSYDRLGRGASDASTSPRTALEMVEDLHALLGIAGLEPPYLFVGHSFGGLLGRLFAHRYRSQMLGLILVDSVHQDQFDVFGPSFPPAAPGEPRELTGLRAFWQGGWRDPKATPEQIDFVASFRQGATVDTLGDLPLHVMTAGTMAKLPAVPEKLRPQLQASWEKLQRQFLQLSSVATQSLHPESGHFIQRDEPDAITHRILAMIEQTRAA